MRGIQRWMRAVGVSRPVVVDVPADAAGARADRGDRSGADDLLLHRRFSVELAEARRIVTSEEAMFKDADLVFVTSEKLRQRAARFASACTCSRLP